VLKHNLNFGSTKDKTSRYKTTCL